MTFAVGYGSNPCFDFERESYLEKSQCGLGRLLDIIISFAFFEGTMCLRYPPMGGINRKAKHKHNETIYFQSKCIHIVQNVFAQTPPASTLRIMPPIEFAFYFFRLIPPMDGRRVFTKMSQRPIERSNSLLKYGPNQTCSCWLLLAEARGGCCAGLRWAELGWAAGLTQPSPAQATEPNTT